MVDNHQFVQVTRTLVKRGLTDIERKVVAGMLTGSLGYGAINVLSAYGIVVPENVALLIPMVCGWFGQYMAHSLGAVTTVQTTPAGATQVSTSTGSIRIPAAYLPQPHPVPVSPAPAPNPGPVADPEPLEVPDQDDATAVNPGVTSVTQILADPNAKYATAGSFLSHLPSAQDDH